MTDTSSRIVVEKVNVLLIGPTGSGCYLFTVVTSYMLIIYSLFKCLSCDSGKTFIVQKIAEILDVPFASTDCTSLTQAGYVGDDIDVVLSKLYQNSGNDLDKTQRGEFVSQSHAQIFRNNSFV